MAPHPAARSKSDLGLSRQPTTRAGVAPSAADLWTSTLKTKLANWLPRPACTSGVGPAPRVFSKDEDCGNWCGGTGFRVALVVASFWERTNPWDALERAGGMVLWPPRQRHRKSS